MRIYVASSWRNHVQPVVVDALRRVGHEVYDFRHPFGGDHLGFSWATVDPDWQKWGPERFRDRLGHPVARAGFDSDHGAMEWADAFVLVLPCNRSAHLELGWACGKGKRTVILLSEVGFEPELMYLEADAICVTLSEVLEHLATEK